VPSRVVLVVVALGPQREGDDVVGVLLVARDPDRFAAVMLQALAEDLQEQALDIVPTPGLGVKLGDHVRTHDGVPSLVATTAGCGLTDPVLDLPWREGQGTEPAPSLAACGQAQAGPLTDLL
jgi:hypothetical protein